MVHAGFLVVLLTTGSFVAGADPNALADQILSRTLGYVLENTWSWIKLPPISINSTYYDCDASAEPFPTFEIANIFRNGAASFVTTDIGQILTVNVTITNLKTGYQLFSHDIDGECKFVQWFESEDNNAAVLKILILPHFDGNCSGAVDSYQIVEFWSMELPLNPVLCGEKSRDMILKDLSDLHQPDIRAALQIYAPLAVTEVLKDFNMCP